MDKIKVYVGIDVAKDTSKVALLDNQGKTIFKPFSISNSKAGILKMFSKLSKYDPDEMVFGMEVSSNYWENMYSYLEEKGFKVILLNSYQVKKYSQAMGNKIKTDSVDSTSITRLLIGKSYGVLYLTDEAAITLRELVRTKYSFERRAKKLKKAILSMLSLVFPEYIKVFPHPFSKVSMEILSKYPTASHMARGASVSRLVKIFRKYQGCNFTKDKAKISKIEDKIKSYLIPDGPGGGSSSYEILNSIKGVGFNTIATFMGFVGDTSRFSSSDKLISYLGFYPRIFESGKYKRKNPTMVKAGPKELRYMLYLSSVACLKHNRGNLENIIMIESHLECQLKRH